MAIGGVNSFDQEYLLQLQGAQNGSTTGLGSIDKTSEPVNLVSEKSEKAGSLEDIEADFAAAAQDTTTVRGAQGRKASSLKPTGEQSEKIKEEIEELEKEKEENLEKMEKIEEEIEELAEEAEENMLKAAKEQEKAVEEYEEETQKAIDENIAAYIAANKEGGEGMTREELQANIKGSLANVPEVAEAVSALVEANEQINEIESLLGDLNKLTVDTNSLIKEIDIKYDEFDKVTAKEVTPPSTGGADSGNCNPRPCEPQGFQDNEGNKYDFFIDKDGNGDLSNETEFLGYEGGKEGQAAAWKEMTDLDVDKNGSVDASELSAAGVMVYKTDKNGNKTAMTIEEAFGKESDLAINTKQHDTAKEGVGPNNFNVGTGSENNELWGTFDVTLNGENLNGYQTNDDINWLKENYNFTDYSLDGNNITDGTIEKSDIENSVFAEELLPHVNFFQTYTQKVQELKESLSESWEQLGLTKESLESLNEQAVVEAGQKADNFFNSLDNKDIDITELTPEEKELLEEEGLIAA